MQTLKQSQALRRRCALVKIVQPIGGVPDYAEPVKAADPAKPRRPMAQKVYQDGASNPLILAATGVLLMILAALAVAGRMLGA